MNTIVVLSGSPAVRVSNNKFKFCATSESGVIFFFDPLPVVVSGHRLSDVGDPLDVFGLVIPAVERRNVLAVSYASRKFPGRAPDGCVILRTFVGGALQPHLLDRTDDRLATLVRAELQAILGVTGEPDFVRVQRHVRAMPQYHVGHLDRIAAIERQFSTHRGLQPAGNAYHGVGIPDCIHSGQQAAERLTAERFGESSS